MLKQLKKGIRICIIFAIVITLLPQHMILQTQGASTEDKIDTISFKDNIGYYANDGKLFTYDKATKISTQVILSIEENEKSDVLSSSIIASTYDGTNVYVLTEDMVLYAYNVHDFNKSLWKQSALKDATLSFGGTIYVKDDVLYVNALKESSSSILQVQTKNGEKISIKIESRNVEQAIPYVSNNEVIFSGKDIARNTQGTTSFIKLYDDKYKTSVYDAVNKQIFAIGENNTLYTVHMDLDTTYYTLYKTKYTFPGKQSRAMMIGDTPAIVSLEKDNVILYFYNGIYFERQDTKLATTSIQNIAFDNGQVFIVDAQHNVQSAQYILPIKQEMDEQAKLIQKDILTIYTSLSEDIRYLTLEKKESITALANRYQALTPSQQEQALASFILQEMISQTTKLQQNVDDINKQISKLSTPEEFSKEDRQKALDIQKLYNALATFDKTLIDQKLLRILDKIQAFAVEDEIATLPAYASITITDLARIQEISQHYDVLKQEWKKDVKNYTSLQRLENRIYELMGSNTLGDAYWSNFGGNKTSNATTNTKTPYTQDDVQENFKLDGKYQESIIVDNYIYTIRDKNYLTILDNKGNVIAETKLYNKIGFFSRLAYGDGKIYVALSDRIQAFDAKTLRPLWLSQAGNQFISTITYHNGYIYSGMTTGGGGDKGKTNGYFFALNVKDEDVNNTFEVKDFAWICGESKNTGYYWAGAAIVNDAVIFAGDSGEVISHHLTQNIVFDRYLLGDSKVRANVSYIESEKAILVGTQDSHTLFKIKVNDNGSFQKENIQSVNIDGEITGGIAYYNGRAYIPSGGMYAKGFSVVDTKSMKLAYVNKEIGSQSYPLLTTAYATSDNKYEVKIYAMDYKTGDLLMMSDAQGQSVAKMEVLAQGYGTYNSGSVTPDAYGNLYICGSSFSGGGPLYSIQSKDAKFTILDMENAITNFPSTFTYTDKKAFQTLLNTYLAMSESEQKQVRNADVLMEYEEKMQKLTEDKVASIQNCIDALPKQITMHEQEGIVKAIREYGELLESDQLRIQGYNTLLDANEKLQELLNGFEQLRKDIDAIDLNTITLQDEVQINILYARYEKLNAQERGYITNYDKLVQAQKIINRLRDELQIPNLNLQVDTILQIQNLTLHEEKQMLSLYNTLMKLDKDVQAKISGFDMFIKAYERLIAQRKDVDWINDAIWNEIQPLDIQYRDRDKILEIYKRYHQLATQNKEFVPYVEDLQYAKIVIDKMDKGILAKELFEKIKMANVSYQFETTTMDSSLLRFNFVGKDIKNPIDFSFKVSSTSLDDESIHMLCKDAMILSFAHKGDFPGLANIEMQSTLKDGTYRLYYYNPIKKSAEFVQDIEVRDEMTSFKLTHASTYFISKELIEPINNAQLPVNNAQSPINNAQLLINKDVKTGDSSNIEYLYGMVFICLGAIVLLIKKQKI